MTDLLEITLYALVCPLLLPLVVEKQNQENEEGKTNE